jgi:Skp family chaperone for outer membrane proteins
MADQTSTWALRLEDQTSGAAESATQALTKLGKEIKADSREITEMQRALKNLERATTPNVAQMDQLTKRIAAQKEAVAVAQSEYISLGGSFKQATAAGAGFETRIKKIVEAQAKLKPSAGATAVARQIKQVAEVTPNASKQLRQLGELATGLPGPLARLGLAASSLGKVIGLGGAGLGLVAGVTLGVAALAALGVAAGVAMYKLYKLGTAGADAARNEKLHYEALIATHDALQRVPGGAKALQEMLDRVAMKVPASREQLAKFHDQLIGIGLQGPELERALESMGIVAGTQGDAAAQSFFTTAAEMKKAGANVDKLSAKIKTQLGGVAAQRMKSLEVQAQKTKESFGKLFDGVQIDKWLDAWQELNTLISQSTASGRALRTLMEMMIQPVIDGVTWALPHVRDFFEQLIILALQSTIVFLRLKNALQFKFKPPGAEDRRQAYDRGTSPLRTRSLDDALGRLKRPSLTGSRAAMPATAPKLRVDLAGFSGVSPLAKPGEPAPPRTHEPDVGTRDADSRGTAPASGKGGGATITRPTGTTAATTAPVSVTIGDIHIHASTDEPKGMALDFRRELEAVLEKLSLEIGAPVTP